MHAQPTRYGTARHLAPTALNALRDPIRPQMIFSSDQPKRVRSRSLALDLLHHLVVVGEIEMVVLHLERPVIIAIAGLQDLQQTH